MYDQDYGNWFVVNEPVEDSLADEKCLHECHKDDSKKHKDPCCFQCVLCGQEKIKISSKSAHELRCRVSSGC